MLDLQPITWKEANIFIRENHRHHLPPQGWKFGVAVNKKVSLKKLMDQFKQAWSRDTSYYPEKWNNKNPSLGQCAVTALIVQDWYGGELVRCKVNAETHYFNKLSNFGGLDLTIEQFETDREKHEIEIIERDFILSFPDTVKRYEILKSRIQIREIVGVVTVGRPVSRVLDDGWTLEVTRCCTIGINNAASMLYGAAWRASKAMGYKRLITYTLIDEPGTSLNAAGFKELYVTRKNNYWNCYSRPRIDKHPLIQKRMWERT